MIVAYPHLVPRVEDPPRMNRLERLLAKIAGRDPDEIEADLKAAHRELVEVSAGTPARVGADVATDFLDGWLDGGRRA